MKLVIYSHSIFKSAGARALRDSLTANMGTEVPIIPARTIKLRHQDRVALINWGASAFPNPNNWMHGNSHRRFTILNPPQAVRIAAKKDRTFSRFEAVGIPTVENTTDMEIAAEWLTQGHCVVARTVVNGHGGEGIVIVENPQQELPAAPVYTKYKKKKYEYRVHVFQDAVIDIQQKKRERGVEIEGDRAKIRNRANGWVFCREDIIPPETDVDFNELKRLAIASVDSLGLDFGAADIIYNQRENRYYVLEVNTAPGIEGTTLTNYTEAFARWYSSLV